MDGKVAYTNLDGNGGGNTTTVTAAHGGDEYHDEDSNRASKASAKASKASSFAPNLVSLAAALAGETYTDFGGVADSKSSSAGASATASASAAGASSSGGGKGKGKKKGESSKKGKGKGGGVDGAAAAAGNDKTGGGEEGVDKNQGSKDAHLIMAVTQAINILLSYLKKQNAAATAASAKKEKAANQKPVGAMKKGAAKSNEPTQCESENEEHNNSEEEEDESIKQAAITLISLSQPLLTTLVNDRTLLETITKSSHRASASASPRAGGAAAASSSTTTTTAMGGMNYSMDTDDEVLGSLVHQPTIPPPPRGGGSSSKSSKGRGMSPERSSSKGGSSLGVGTKRIVMSHAKAVVGRAMTSGVMGALWGLEALGNLKPNFDDMAECVEQVNSNDAGKAAKEEVQDDIAMKEDDDRKPSASLKNEEGDKDVAAGQENDNHPSTIYSEQSILRKSLWSALMSLEIAFQLNPRPKLLMTSGVSSPTSGGSGGTSGSVYGRSVTSARTMGDFDHMLSVAMLGGTFSQSVGGSSSSGSAGHAHLSMGSDTIAMWNGMLQRILADYKVEFHLLANSPAAKSKGATEPEKVGVSPLEGENEHLAQICHGVTQDVFGKEEDTQLISLVLDGSMKHNEDDADTSGPPAKKTRRTKKGSKAPSKMQRAVPPAENYSELSALLSQRMENHVTFDCHVSIRRWAVLCFGWLCQGQKRLLEMGSEMLGNGEGWEKVLELPASSPTDKASRASEDASDTKKKKKKAGNAATTMETQATKPQDGIPGNVLLITFLSCMIDMIYDAGATGGLSPPSSGWMDEYVKAVIGSMTEDKKTEEESKPAAVEVAAATVAASTAVAELSEAPVRRSSRKRSKTTKGSQQAASKASRSPAPRGSPGKRGSPSSSSGNGGSNKIWERPDVRNDTAVLTKMLIEAHARCLHDNVVIYSKSTTQQPKGSFVIVNDDDSFSTSTIPSSSTSRRRSTAARSISGAVASLIQCYYPFMHRTLGTLGRAAASSSYFASSDGKSRIVSIGCGIVMRIFLQSYERYNENPIEEAAVVIDAKLVSLAVSQLANCLKTILSDATRATASSGSASATSTASAALSTIPENVVSTYELNTVLDITPANAKQAIAAAAVAAASSDTKGSSNYSSYGGAFAIMPEEIDNAKKKSSSTSSSSGRSNSAEVLSIFIRAQLLTTTTPTSPVPYHDAMTSLLKSLLAVVRICYDFSSETNSQGGVGHESSATSRGNCDAKTSKKSKKKKRKASEFTTSVLESGSALAIEKDTKTIR